MMAGNSGGHPVLSPWRWRERAADWLLERLAPKFL